ncbi:MAG: ATP-binding protein [Bdellovibrionota bacterium]
MVVSIHSCALVGLAPNLVTCEIDLAKQLPNVTLVGLPSSLTQESRERVRAAVVNSGFDWPARKVTINLLPASLPKWGSHFELPMALGILAASFECPIPHQIFAIGELSLSGEIRPCGWLSAIAEWLLGIASDGTGFLVAHEKDVEQLLEIAPSLAERFEMAGVRTLAEALLKLQEAGARVMSGRPALKLLGRVESKALEETTTRNSFQLLTQVQDEPLGILAALVAVAGQHHCLFVGPHGMGKSMLVQAIASASRPMSAAEKMERTSSLKPFGEFFSEWNSKRSARPVVHLQTSISRAALEGALLNSGQVMPGELTRAHNGIVVADEFLEFRRDVLEAFRQPIEDGVVRLQRAKFRTYLPARFQLLATTNLCPCGYFGLERRPCRCTDPCRKAYQRKLSGPMMDRFDLIVMLGQREQNKKGALIPKELLPYFDALLDSSTWSERVERASMRRDQKQEGIDVDGPSLWAELSCDLSDRGKMKIARVSRTLALLLDQPRNVHHLKLALLIRQDLDDRLRSALKIKIQRAEFQLDPALLNKVALREFETVDS